MLILTGTILACLGLGTTLAAKGHPTHQNRILRCGAALLCAGITLIAAFFPMI